jgi:hypothetical protein
MMKSIGRHAAALLTLVLVVGVSAALAQSPKGSSQPQDPRASEQGKVVNEVVLPHVADNTPTLRSPPQQEDVKEESDSRTDRYRDHNRSEDSPKEDLGGSQ